MTHKKFSLTAQPPRRTGAPAPPQVSAWQWAVRRAVWWWAPLMLAATLAGGWWTGEWRVRRAESQALAYAQIAAHLVDESLLGQRADAPPGDLRSEFLNRLVRRIAQNHPAQPPVRLWLPAGQGMQEFVCQPDFQSPRTAALAEAQQVVSSGQSRLARWQAAPSAAPAASALAPVPGLENPVAAVIEIGLPGTYLEATRMRYRAVGGVLGAGLGLMTGVVLAGVFYRRKLASDLQSLNQALAEELANHQRADANVRKLSRALENNPIAVVITDAEGRIEYVNPKFTELTGYAPDEVAGRNPSLMKSGLTAPAVYEDLWQSLRSRGYWVGELLNRRKDGALYWEIAYISSLKDGRGAVTHYVAALEDITQRKQAQEELQAAKLAAEEAAQAKSEFLANMSHEIRTPMNGVIGFTSILEHTPLNAEQTELVSNIRRSGEALLLLLNDILDYSKIEAGKLELHPEDFGVADCVREVLQVVAPKAAQKELNLAALLGPDVPARVFGDALRLRQVLLNLVGNAVKFTSHGEVVVQVSLGDPDRPPPEDRRHLVLHFQVRDTGPGIPPERRARLFQKFSQVDGSVTRRHGGTGLGLAISKSLAELMGGRIWLDSQPNEGATFHFTIGCQPAATGGAAAPPLPPLAGRSLLLLSANYTHRNMMAAAAQALQLTLLKAATLDRAWHLLLTEAPPDYVLIEPWGSPAQLRDFVQELRQTLPTARLAVLASREAHLQHIQPLRLPLAGVLPKPLLSTDLPRQLAEVLLNLASATPMPAATLDAHLAERLPMRILLVDDNPINLQVGGGVLQKLGYQPDRAADGLEALDAMRKQAYDLVLLDVQMPRMDGLEVARHVQEKFPAAQRPVLVALTAGAMQGDRERCLAAGMSDYLSKPVRAAQLQQIMEKWYPVIASRRPLSEVPNPAPALHSPAAHPPSAPQTETDSNDGPVDFARLAEVNNDCEAAMAEMAQLFEEQASELLGGVAAGLAAREAAVVKTHAHKLRGSCGACGMMALIAPLAALERLAQDGQWTSAETQWQEVQQHAQRVRACLRERFKYNPISA